jgi:hypothetical protein
MAELMDGAVQQAPQEGRQFMRRSVGACDVSLCPKGPPG